MIMTYRVWRISRLNTRAIEQKTDSVGHFPLPVAEGIHQLFKCRSPLDLEEHLIVVVGDFYVEVLRWCLFGRVVASGTW